MPPRALPPNIMSISTNENQEISLWHRRMAHLDYESIKAVRDMTPYEALHGSPKRQRKLKPRARKLRLIGYRKGTNQYKISQNSTIQTTTNRVTNRTQKITYPNIESVGALLLIFISTFLSYLPIIQHIDLLKPMGEQFSISQTLLTLSRPPMRTQSAVQNQKKGTTNTSTSNITTSETKSGRTIFVYNGSLPTNSWLTH
jgi:hypothetical protein